MSSSTTIFSMLIYYLLEMFLCASSWLALFLFLVIDSIFDCVLLISKNIKIEFHCTFHFQVKIELLAKQEASFPEIPHPKSGPEMY